MEYLIIGIIFYFGAIVGSFLNVVILRLPEEKTLTGRSACISCHHILGVLELFPLLSYLALGGRCRHCLLKISPRYFIIEFITGLLFAGLWLVMAPTEIFGLLLFIRNCFVVAVLLSVFVIDLEHFLILDSIVFSASVVVLAFNLILALVGGYHLFSTSGLLVSGLVGGLLGFLPFWLIWYFSHGRWMGFGDVKLGLFLGLVLGWPQIFVGYFIAVLLGGAISVFLLALTKKTLKSQIPFGTFLSFGALIAMLYGSRLLNWYVAFLGF
ncbi:MAG: prepilin peptidase [Candidatus Doudnabacteria bacterium]|jgi:leader peptidase (prepilin peptidase)/N-methyltransferase